MTLQISDSDGQWKAWEAGNLAGEAWQWTRPDGKHFAGFDAGEPAVIAALSAAITERKAGPLRTVVDAADRPALFRLAEAGFVGERYEQRWTLPVGVAAGWNDAALEPFEVGSPEAFDAGELRRFDDQLRADIPGVWGWRWTAEAWADEHAGTAYDPALYPVAWDRATRRFAGMVRVWRNPAGPRLGLVGVARPYRRRGIGAALLARAFRVLRDRGHAEVATECDAANLASQALLNRAGGRLVGGEVELVRRACG